MFDEPITSRATFYFRIIKSKNNKVCFGITDRNANLEKKSSGSGRVHKSVVTYEGKTGAVHGSFGKYNTMHFSQGDIIAIELDPVNG